MKLLFLSPLSAPSTVRLPSDGYSASWPVRLHRQSRLHTGSSSHLGAPHLRPIIPIPRRLSTRSSTQLSVSDAAAPSTSITCHCMLPSDPPSHYACRIPITYSNERMPKYILAYPSVGNPPPYSTTTGPVSPPTLVPCLPHAEFKYGSEGHSLCHRCLEPVDICLYVLSNRRLQNFLAPSRWKVPSCCLLVHLPVTCHKKPAWTPTIHFSMVADKTHISAQNRSTACTTAL